MNDIAFFDRILGLPPVDKSRLPHITPAMVSDSLSMFECVDNKQLPMRHFRWLSIAKSNIESIELNTTSVLFVGYFEEVRSLLNNIPSAFGVGVITSDSTQSDIPEDYDDSKMICIKADNLALVITQLHMLFTEMLIWEDDLRNASLRDAALDEFLAISKPVIKNFIFISDNHFNLLAHTKETEPLDAMHQMIIDNKSLSSNILNERRFRLPEHVFYTRKASELTPFDRVSYPVHINKGYIGSVSMACNQRADTQGLRDQFLIFVQYIKPAFERFWYKRAEIQLPTFYFFEKLLNHEDISSEYLISNMQLAKMEDASRFKLILIDIDNDVEPEKCYDIMQSLSMAYDKQAIIFPYERAILVLIHAHGPNPLSHVSTKEQMMKHVYIPFGIISFVSSVFNDILNLDLAYQQTLLVKKYSSIIDLERRSYGENKNDGIYYFEEALVYSIMDNHEIDETFLRFAFSCSIAQILFQEDLENNTKYLVLIWFYLEYGRNATSVAEKLLMHRNTVLYHVNKIENRFNFDLGDKTARDWVFLSYKYLFLTVDESELAKVWI